MSETKPSMPAQPKTVELPAQTDRALLEDLTRVVKSGFASLSADIQLVSSDVQVVKDRVVILEKWKIESEERVTKNSIRARASSEDNLRQDAAIAQVITRQDAHEKKLDAVGDQVDAVEKKTDEQTVMLKDIRDTVVGVVTNKKVIFVGKVIFAIAVAYSGLHGLKVLP